MTNPWSAEERAILREIHATPIPPQRRMAEYARRLPDRTLNAIRCQSQAMHITRSVDRRPWTPEACARLREQWLAGQKMADIAADLQRSAAAIAEKARRLGLPRKQRWARIVVTAEMDQAIREEYASARIGMCRRLAKRFNVEIGWIKSRARQLGLTRNTKHYAAPWGPEEDRIVENAHEQGGVRFVAQQLKKAGYHRSLHAVHCRVHILKLRWKNREVYNASQVGEAMGVDSKTVSRWIRLGYLKARKENPSGMSQCEEAHCWLIQYTDLRRFLIDHVSRYRLATCDRFWFVAMLSNTGGVGHIQHSCGSGDGSGFDEMRIAA